MHGANGILVDTNPLLIQTANADSSIVPLGLEKPKKGCWRGREWCNNFGLGCLFVSMYAGFILGLITSIGLSYGGACNNNNRTCNTMATVSIIGLFSIVLLGCPKIAVAVGRFLTQNKNFVVNDLFRVYNCPRIS